LCPLVGGNKEEKSEDPFPCALPSRKDQARLLGKKGGGKEKKKRKFFFFLQGEDSQKAHVSTFIFLDHKGKPDKVHRKGREKKKEGSLFDR